MKRIYSLFITAFIMVLTPFIVSAKSVIQTINETEEANYAIDTNYGWTFNAKNATANPSDYHLIKSKQDAQSKAIKVKDDEDYTVNRYYYIDNEADCSSGKVYILYNNIGMYQGKKVNLKITLNKCSFPKETGLPDGVSKRSVGFGGKSMDVFIDGIRSVDLKYEFLNQSGEKINIKGYGTFRDLDYSQAFKMGTGIDKAYVYGGEYSRVCTATNDNHDACTTWGAYQHIFPDSITNDSDYTTRKTAENVVQSSNLETFSGIEYKYAWATILFSGGEFNLTYYVGQPEFNNSRFGGGMFKFDPDSLVPFKVEDPVKSVDKTSVNRGEEFTYTSSHRVPYITKDGTGNKYSAYSFKDVLEPCLTTTKSDVVIMDDEALDVTNNFDITLNTDSNGSITVSAVAKSDFIAGDSFYGHEYQFMIKTTVKDNYDLSKYINSDKSGYIIPNKASISVTDKSGVSNKETNKVDVVVPIPKEVVKTPDTGKYISTLLITLGSVLLVAAIITLSILLNKKKASK